MSFQTVIGWITGDTAGARNNERRRAEDKAYKAAKEQWTIIEDERERAHEFTKEQYENQLKQNEENLRYQEVGIIDSFDKQKEMRDFEFDMANRAYDKSVSQATNQKEFNQIAFEVANQEQDAKIKEDFLGIVFDEKQTFLDYKAKSSGLQMNKSDAVIAADISRHENALGYTTGMTDIGYQKSKKLTDLSIRDAQSRSKFAGDIGSFGIQRREKRSQAQAATQKAILAGMKAAGALRSRGTNGRSSAKTVIGVLAESGAMQASIANGLMYAEESMDLSVAQLQDMFIADQTMVLVARNNAEMDAAMESSKLTAKDTLQKKKIQAELDKQISRADLDLRTLDDKLALDEEIIAASRQSIKERDAVVRNKINNARKQSDLNAEAAILLKPERLPAPTDPRELYAEYDNPETEDYVELFFRPDTVEFPEYVPTRKPERDDFRGERENVLASNIMGGISVAGMLAGGIGAMTTAGAIGSVGTGANAVRTFAGMSGAGWSTIGNSLGGFGGYAR